MTFITKPARAETFRHRRTEAMARAGFSKSTLAAEIRVNRSTISQLLTEG